MTYLRAGSPLIAALLAAMIWSGRAQTTHDNLGGTSWQLVEFQGSDDTTLLPSDRTKYTIAFDIDGTVSVQIDCNRGRGTWKSEAPNQLEFGPLALTRAMCPSSPLNDRMPRDWEHVRSYVLKDGHLFLALMVDAGIYEFEPVAQENPAATARLKGTATYRERIVLPPGAVFEATLEDVSKADAPSNVVARTRIQQPGTPPIAFEIPYDPSRIDPNHTYGVRGRIVVDGKLFFTTDLHYPAFSAGQSNEVALLLRRVGASTPSPSSGGGTATLENTYWKLMRLGDTTVTVSPKQREPYLILNSEGKRIGGSGGCNSLTGGYQLSGANLTFGQMVSTMMACLEGMDTEKAFLTALAEVKTWKITGQQLDLFDSGGRSVAQFEARYMK
jgi:putative lipoprotein